MFFPPLSNITEIGFINKSGHLSVMFCPIRSGFIGYIPSAMFHQLCSVNYVPSAMFHRLCSIGYVPSAMLQWLCVQIMLMRPQNPLNIIDVVLDIEKDKQ